MKKKNDCYTPPTVEESCVSVEAGIAASGEIIVEYNDYGILDAPMMMNGEFEF